MIEEGGKNLDKRQERKTEDRPERGLGVEGVGGVMDLWVAKREEEELKDFEKKGGEMHQDAWVVSQSHPSCCGNVMETPGSFQILSTMVMMWQHTEASTPAHSLRCLRTSAEISGCITALILQRFEGHNLHWEQNE